MTDTPDDLPSPDEYLRKMATGEHWSYQRCGRYAYQRVLVHTANPDHLVHGPIVPPIPGSHLKGRDVRQRRRAGPDGRTPPARWSSRGCSWRRDL
jgi:hypothetical protein